MRKVFKQENVNSASGTVAIPDVVFEIPVFDTEEEAIKAGGQAISKETYSQIESNIRAEMDALLEAERRKASAECDDLLRKARMGSQEILKDAESKAEKIISEAKNEAEAIKLDAYNKGKEQGIEEKSNILSELSQSISDSLEEMKKSEDEYFEKYAQELKHLAMDMTEKIICQKLEEDDLFMYNIVKAAVKSVRDVPWIKVEVSGRLSGYIDSLEEELNMSGHRVEFIVNENGPDDVCVLNHSNGVVIATLSEQLKILRDFIDNIDKGGSDEYMP